MIQNIFYFISFLLLILTVNLKSYELW